MSVSTRYQCPQYFVTEYEGYYGNDCSGVTAPATTGLQLPISTGQVTTGASPAVTGAPVTTAPISTGISSVTTGLTTGQTTANVDSQSSPAGGNCKALVTP